MSKIPAFKVTRPDGTDFRTGTIDYHAAMVAGVPVEVLDAAPASVGPCGRGIHVSPTARKTIQFAERGVRPWRYFEGIVDEKDIVAQDANKMRVRRFLPLKEIELADIFGADFAERIERVKIEAATWKDIPWLKPTKTISKKKATALVSEWRESLTPWLRNKEYQLPAEIKIVDNWAAAAAAAADADADAAAAAADADAAAAADADAAAADADADAAAAAADAAAAAADAAAAAADAAAADADAAADAARRFRYRLRWYIRPYYVLRRSARWYLVGMEQPNLWKPLVELYRLGAMPIGFTKNAGFVVFCPKKVK